MLNSTPQNTQLPAATPPVKLSGGQFDQDKPINPELLHQELQAALGDKLDSVDTGVPIKEGFFQKQVILVRIKGDVTKDDQALVEKIIKDHDASKLSQRQQHEKNRADAEERLKIVDFAALRGLNGQKQVDSLIDLLEDILKVLHKEA